MFTAVHKDPVLEQLVNELTGNWPVEQIVLFGSRATGANEELSDYDLLIIVPDEKYFHGISTEIRRGLRHIQVAKDLVVARRSTVERLGKIPGTVYFEALTEGQSLYAAA